MIKYTHQDKNQSGLSLLEVLIAILIFSIVILGLVNFKSVLVTSLMQAKNNHLAERIAFELLDCYPDSISVSLPSNWQYKITTTQYSGQCKIVKVTIQSDIGNDITQERWFCSS